jgi:hypothetical protein
MPTFEVHFLTDKNKGFPEGYEALGEVETTKTAEAITEVGKQAGTYRVRVVAEGEVSRLWRWNPPTDPELIDVV